MRETAKGMLAIYDEVFQQYCDGRPIIQGAPQNELGPIVPLVDGIAGPQEAIPTA
jgi:hypothetical protein